MRPPSSTQISKFNKKIEDMIENFIAAFIDYLWWQARREHVNDTFSTDDNIAIFPLATPLLAEPAAITFVKVVASSPAGKLDIVIGYGALVVVMLAKAIIFIIASLAELYINQRVTLVFSRITAIILAALSVQYIIEGLQPLSVIQVTS
jgi:multiple antibiotic resistance protein